MKNSNFALLIAAIIIAVLLLFTMSSCTGNEDRHAQGLDSTRIYNAPPADLEEGFAYVKQEDGEIIAYPIGKITIDKKPEYKSAYYVRLANRSLVNVQEGNNQRVFNTGDTVCIHNLGDTWIIDNTGVMKNDTISNFWRIGVIE